MSRVETALEELIAAVIASEEYREYDRQKQIMKEQPELKAQIDRFRQENFELQNSVQSDELFDRTDEFSRRLEEFRKNPLFYLYNEVSVINFTPYFERAKDEAEEKTEKQDKTA